MIMVPTGMCRLRSLFLLLALLSVNSALGKKRGRAGKKRGASLVFSLDPRHFVREDVLGDSTNVPDPVSRNFTAVDVATINAMLADEYVLDGDHTATSNARMMPRPVNGSMARVAYGDSAPKGVLDFAVHLNVDASDGTYTCAASLIAKKWLVSAAHCFLDEYGLTSARSITAIIGEKDIRRASSRSKYNVKTLYVPRIFQPDKTGNLEGDIALLRLNRSVKNITPVVLASNTTRIPPWLIVAGWGLTETNTNPSPKLKYAAVPYLSTTQMEEFQEMTGIYFEMERDKMAAGLGDSDSCSGDSGGPLIIPSKHEFTNSQSDNNVLVGVVSYGLSGKCQSSRDRVGFYTRIDPYEAWIKSKIKPRRKKKSYRAAATIE